RMRQPLLDRAVTPRGIGFFLFHASLNPLRELEQTFGSVVPAVEENILYPFQEFFIDLIIHFEHRGIYDAHVHPAAYCMVQECGMHGLPYLLIAAEAERNVTNSAAYLGMREVFLDPLRRTEEVECIISMLLESGRHRENIRIEDDILGRELYAIDKDSIGPFTDGDSSLIGVGLTFLIEGHDHNSGAVFLYKFSLSDKLLFSSFKAY